MKRELLQISGKHRYGCWCCPGHDKWPDETYKNNRSKRARSRDKKAEHQLVRTVTNREMLKETFHI
jgi:3'-phosphoadenosine 5'-phosphosulfate sulfotransferase (PAPS reductase)/FAD synthetase